MDSHTAFDGTGSRIHPWFRFWLDDFPGSFHARHGWRFLLPLIAQHFSARAAIHEFPHGRNDAGHDSGHEGDAKQPQSFRTNVWFVMSMALLAGFIVAYPMNWWLVANHLKHGMMTVGRRDQTKNHQSIQEHLVDHHAAMSDSGLAFDIDIPPGSHSQKSSKHSHRLEGRQR